MRNYISPVADLCFCITATAEILGISLLLDAEMSRLKRYCSGNIEHISTVSLTVFLLCAIDCLCPLCSDQLHILLVIFLMMLHD